MSYRPENIEITFDPDGSIFLPKDRLREEFLSFEGDPYEILDQLRQHTDKGIEQLYDALQFSLLQSRGTKPWPEDMSEELFARELEKRVYFYTALKQVMGSVAVSKAA